MSAVMSAAPFVFTMFLKKSTYTCKQHGDHTNQLATFVQLHTTNFPIHAHTHTHSHSHTHTHTHTQLFYGPFSQRPYSAGILQGTSVHYITAAVWSPSGLRDRSCALPALCCTSPRRHHGMWTGCPRLRRRHTGSRERACSTPVNCDAATSQLRNPDP